MGRIRKFIGITALLAVFATAGLAAPAGWSLPVDPIFDRPVDEGNQETGPLGVVPIETIWMSSAYSFGFDADEPTYFVIQTEEQWWTLWAREPDLPRPSVDFGTRTMLVATSGRSERSSTSIEVTDVVFTLDGTYVATATLTVAGPSCATASVLTYPVHIVSMPKAEAPFVYFTDVQRFDCP